jgi:hypothetical protein
VWLQSVLLNDFRRGKGVFKKCQRGEGFGLSEHDMDIISSCVKNGRKCIRILLVFLCMCVRAWIHIVHLLAPFFLNAVSFEFELAGGGWELDGTWLGAAASWLAGWFSMCFSPARFSQLNKV